MRPRTPIPPRVLAPLRPDDRRFIKACADAGDPPKLIAVCLGRPVGEVLQVIESGGGRRHG